MEIEWSKVCFAKSPIDLLAMRGAVSSMIFQLQSICEGEAVCTNENEWNWIF